MPAAGRLPPHQGGAQLIGNPFAPMKDEGRHQ